MSEYADPREFVHCIDRDGRISFVNDAWLAFAAENGWPTTASRVLGAPLMQQIADPETRHIYQLLIDRVRDEGRQASFIYRCDSPDCRRLMEMRITESALDLVAFSNRVLHLERRDPINLLDPRFRTRSSDILTVCSWCKSVLADHVWIEVEQAVGRLEILTERVLPQISHGICPSCSEHMTGVSEGR